MFGLLKPNSVRTKARAIVEAAAHAARNPALFGDGRTPDTFDGRFQVATLMGVLAMRRIRRDETAGKLGQEFADILFRSFDEGLREAGVGDLSVAKHMKKLAGAFYGRLAAYDPLLAAGDAPALAAALSRNVWDAQAAPFAPELAAHVLGLAARLDSAPLEALAATETWTNE